MKKQLQAFTMERRLAAERLAHLAGKAPSKEQPDKTAKPDKNRRRREETRQAIGTVPA